MHIRHDEGRGVGAVGYIVDRELKVERKDQAERAGLSDLELAVCSWSVGYLDIA